VPPLPTLPLSARSLTAYFISARTSSLSLSVSSYEPRAALARVAATVPAGAVLCSALPGLCCAADDPLTLEAPALSRLLAYRPWLSSSALLLPRLRRTDVAAVYVACRAGALPDEGRAPLPTLASAPRGVTLPPLPVFGTPLLLIGLPPAVELPRTSTSDRSTVALCLLVVPPAPLGLSTLPTPPELAPPTLLRTALAVPDVVFVLCAGTAGLMRWCDDSRLLALVALVVAVPTDAPLLTPPVLLPVAVFAPPL
jgi:hypothetical protein